MARLRISIVFFCLVFAYLRVHAAVLSGPQNETQAVLDSRIVGGAETSIEQFPFLVRLDYNWLWWFWSFYCGGSLISETTVLSAASCFAGSSTAWQARLGSSTNSGGILIRISMITSHSDHKTNDIAILRLATPASLTQKVNVARIPGINYQLPDGASVTAVGWGSSVTDGSSVNQLRLVNINVINQDTCAERYEYLKTQPGFHDIPSLSSGMFCAGNSDDGGKGTCSYDEGGPLVHEDNIVVGIISWERYRCANSYYPGVYTLVSAYSDWIVQYG